MEHHFVFDLSALFILKKCVAVYDYY